MQYEHIAANYERNLCKVTAKVLKDFKNTHAATEIDYLIGKAFQYLSIGIDEKIILKHDLSDLEDSSWESI